MVGIHRRFRRNAHNAPSDGAKTRCAAFVRERHARKGVRAAVGFDGASGADNGEVDHHARDRVLASHRIAQPPQAAQSQPGALFRPIGRRSEPTRATNDRRRRHVVMHLRGVCRALILTPSLSRLESEGRARRVVQALSPLTPQPPRARRL